MTHLDLRSAYNRMRMSDDGPQDDSIATTAFQGIAPNGASCLLKKVGYGVWPLQCPRYFFRLMNHVLEPYIDFFFFFT